MLWYIIAVSWDGDPLIRRVAFRRRGTQLLPPNQAESRTELSCLRVGFSKAVRPSRRTRAGRPDPHLGGHSQQGAPIPSTSCQAPPKTRCSKSILELTLTQLTSASPPHHHDRSSIRLIRHECHQDSEQSIYNQFQ